MFEKVELIDKSLPDPAELYTKLRSVKDVSLTDFKALRIYAIENSDLFLRVVAEFMKVNEYLEAPEIVLKKLEWYYYVLGGLQGLITALAEKGLELELKGTSNNTDDGKKSATAKDRELYAKGQIADLKGTLSILDNTEKILTSKMFTQRGELKRGI